MVIPALAEALGVVPPPHVPLLPLRVAAELCDIVAAPLRLQLPLTRRRLAFFTAENAFSTAAAQRDFGYQPKRILEQGLSETVAWYRAEGLLDDGGRPRGRSTPRA